MKKIALIFAVIALGLSTGFTGNGDNSTAQTNEIDKQVSLTGKYTHNVVYFKLLMLNESTNGVYSMVKKFDDGTSTSIGVRNFYANSINVPLMYSFLDKELSDVDVTYVLYRISKDSKIVQAWTYSSEHKILCEVTEEDSLHALYEE